MTSSKATIRRLDREVRVLSDSVQSIKRGELEFPDVETKERVLADWKEPA
jgi:hypothetical protein